METTAPAIIGLVSSLRTAIDAKAVGRFLGKVQDDMSALLTLSAAMWVSDSQSGGRCTTGLVSDLVSVNRPHAGVSSLPSQGHLRRRVDGHFQVLGFRGSRHSFLVIGLAGILLDSDEQPTCKIQLKVSGQGYLMVARTMPVPYQSLSSNVNSVRIFESQTSPPTNIFGALVSAFSRFTTSPLLSRLHFPTASVGSPSTSTCELRSGDLVGGRPSCSWPRSRTSTR